MIQRKMAALLPTYVLLVEAIPGVNPDVDSDSEGTICIPNFLGMYV